MAETVRDVVIRVSLKQIDSKLTLPNLGAARKEVLNYSKTVVASNQRISNSYKTVNIEVNNFNRQQKEAKKEAKETAKNVVEDYLQAAEGFHKAASGALALTKGLAKISGASEDDLKAAFEPIESALNAFKGATDLISGMVQGYRALQTATSAGAVANTALAASNTAVATTSGAAAAGMTALQVAMGPIGVTFLAIGAAVAAATVALSRFNQTTTNTRSGGRIIGRDIVARIRRAADTADTRARLLGNEGDAARRELVDLRKRGVRRGPYSSSVDEFDQRIKLREPDEQIGPHSFRAKSAKDQLSITRNLQELLALRERERELIERAGSADQKRLSARKEELRNQLQLVNAAKEELATKQRARREAIGSAELRLQALKVQDPLAFSRFRRISDKKGRGEKLSLRDLLFVESTIGATDATTSSRRALASNDFKPLASRFLPGPSGTQGEFTENLLEEERRVRKEVNRVNDSLAENQRTTADQLLRLLPVIDDVQERLAESEFKVRKIEDHANR